MDHSPLGQLPAELRNAIYSDLFVRDFPISLVVRDIKGARRARRYDNDALFGGKSLGLLLACKAIYSEALPVFYGANTFQLLTSQKAAAAALRSFMQNTMVRRNLNMLRHVTLHLGRLATSRSPRRRPTTWKRSSMESRLIQADSATAISPLSSG